MMPISSIRFTSGSSRLWLAYTGCRITCIGHLSGALCPHFQCHSKCTMWIINQVTLLKVLSYYRSCMVSGSCIFVSSVCLLSCPLPLCIHGNSCPLGQLPTIEQCLNRLVPSHNHCKEHTSISVLCIPMRVLRVQYGLHPLYSQS